MILNSIEIENIRSYNHEKIDFPKGITLFEGDIGSGKSTVLMAIEFALFGLGSQKPESLLSKKKNEGHVILHFEVEGKTYEIKRKLKRKGDSISQDSKSCHLVSDGEMEPLSASELKQRILQILRFNEPATAISESRIYRYAVFTPQEEMKKVLSDSKMRLETIRKAFGMEDYKIASDNAKILMSLLKTQIAVTKAGFSNINELRKDHHNATKEQEEESHKVSILTTELTALEKSKTIAHKAVEVVRKKQREKEKIEIKKDGIEENIEKNKSDLEGVLGEIDDKQLEIKESQNIINKLEQIQKPTSKSLSTLEEEIRNFEELEIKLTGINSEIQTISQELPKISKNIGSYRDSNVEDLHTELEKINEILNQFTVECNKVKEFIREAENSKAVLIGRKKDIESRITKVSNLGSKCPVCENVLTEDHMKNLQKEYQENLDTIRNDIKQYEKELSEKSIKEKDLGNQISEKQELETKIHTILPMLQQWNDKNKRLAELRVKLDEFDSKRTISEEKSFPNNGKFKNPLSYVKALRDALIEFNNITNQLEQERFRKTKGKENLDKIKAKKESVEKEILELQRELKDISKKIDLMDDVNAELQKVENHEETIQTNIDELKQKLSTKNENLRHLKNEIQRLDSEISGSKKAQQQYEIFNNCNDWLKDFFIPTLEQVEKQVLRSIQHSFNSIYQNWFSVLIDDPTKQSRIDEDFTPLVEQDGYEQNIEYLSGGEKTSIALSYRLTLNSMIRQETESLKSNLLILDEPTDGFSKTQLSKVRTVLQQLHSQQIILVSHEKELETYVDNIFYISKDGGSSHVFRRNG